MHEPYHVPSAGTWGARHTDSDQVRVHINGYWFEFDPRGAFDLAQSIRLVLGLETPND